MFVILPVLWSTKWTLHGDSECNGFYNLRWVWILKFTHLNSKSDINDDCLWTMGWEIVRWENPCLCQQLSEDLYNSSKSIQRHPRKSPLVVWTQTITPFPAGFVQIDTRVSFSSFPRFLWRSGFTIRRFRICLWNDGSLLSAIVILIFPLNGSL